MQLAITRDQADKRGVFGGHKGVEFSLYVELRLTLEERQLVDRYKLNMYTLTYTNYNGQRVPQITVDQAVRGVSQTMSGVETLVSNERIIKEAAEDFKLLLDVARSFGGEEIVEIGDRQVVHEAP